MMKMSSADFENSKLKNEYIRNNDSQRLIYVNRDRIQSEDMAVVCECFAMPNYPVMVLFGGEGEAVELQSVEMLAYYGVEIIGLAFEREVLRKSGCFNEQLEDLTNYELLCRLLEAGSNCMAFWYTIDKSQELTEQGMRTWAYVLRRNIHKLQEYGCMNDLFQSMCVTAMEQGLFSVLQANMNKMLSNDEEYDKIRENTAPFIVIRGDGTCAGVLQGFADALTEALAGLGQAVQLWSAESLNFDAVDDLCKGMVGFQSRLLSREIIHKIRGKKFQFWFDYPAPFGEMFDAVKDIYVLCQDGFHCEFIRDYFDVPNAMHFPPAGMDGGMIHSEERPYDIVFIGSYFPVQEQFEDVEMQEFYRYMCEHPDKTFDKGLEEWLKQRGICLDKEQFLTKLVGMRRVYRSVIGYYRKKVIDTILHAGYTLQVYGDSWYEYESENGKQLVIHPEVQGPDMLKEWGKAKIGLNIMSWHKAGMTERVANIMLSGAVCVTERTTYLDEHFEDGEELIGLSLEKLEELPEKIEVLLQDDKMRKQIAQNAYLKASREHTWRERAAELLELI